MRIAFLTANLGKIDRNLQSLHVPQTVEIDFHAFDDQNFPPRPSLTPRLQAKIPKMMGWQMVPGYDLYIWGDANITFARADSVAWLVEQLGDADLAFFKHPDFRTTIKAELEHMAWHISGESGNANAKQYHTERYGAEPIRYQVETYLADPAFMDNALYAGGMFIYRNNERTQKVLSDWLLHNALYSIQDQLSLPYVLSKSGCAVHTIDESIWNNRYLDYFMRNDSKMHKWDQYYVGAPGTPSAYRYGDTETYQKGAEFLADCPTVEDWGSGAGGFKRFRSDAKGIDGSVTPNSDAMEDLTTYTSTVDGIFLRHVLEHNEAWKLILSNAIQSARKKICVVLFTPWSEDTTQEIRTGTRINESFGVWVRTLALSREDFYGLLTRAGFSVTEEQVKSKTEYGQETLLYATRSDVPTTARILPRAKTLEYPLVSLFTPTHNTQWLHDLYETLKEQTYPKWQWVIVYNNGATPMDFHDERVKTVHLQYPTLEWVGPLKAIACEHCDGEILVEMDHDDLLTPNALEEVVKAFREHPEIGFAFSNTAYTTPEWGTYPRFDASFGWKYRPFSYKGHALEETLTFPPSPESVSKIWFAPNHLRAFKTSIYRRIGGHRKDMRVLDDGDLMCRMFIEAPMHHIDQCLYIYRVHGENAWLKHNQEIQDNVLRIYDQHILPMLLAWAKRQGLRAIELGGRIAPWSGFETVDLKDADIIHDLNTPWPFADSSVGVIRAMDVLEHLKDPIFTMKEMYRVLTPGGWVILQVPSTDGRGAFQDPTHVSFWNENSFLYYTHRDFAKYIDTPVRFQAARLYTTPHEGRHVCWTHAHLVSLKEGYTPPGVVEI